MSNPKKKKDTNSLPQLSTVPQAVKVVTCSFHQFFAVWAQLQKPAWDIPDFHIDILDFLSNYENWENNTGLIQVFRGAAKSTIVGLFMTWMLAQNPTLRFLVLSADKKTAVKIATDIATIVERHPLAKHLHGQENVWRADTLMVQGATDGRNPSVTSWGVMSNITGARADWIIYDDTEVPKNSRTELEREKLREKLDEPTHILVPGGYELFVGTPHSFDSIYTELEGSSGKEDPFRTGCSQLKIPIMENVTGEFPFLEGEAIWPERFDKNEILKRQSGSSTKGHFLSQYLLLPYNPGETTFDPTLIAVYSHELDVIHSNGATLARINGIRVMGCTAYWDPALSQAKTDASVLAIVYSTDDGHYFIHRVQKLHGDANEQIEQAIQLMLKHEVTHLNIESNAIGAFLPALFRSKATGRGVTCEGVATSKNKAEKIMEAYESRLSAGYIHCHKSVMETPFRTELRDFSPSGRGHDDFIDAPAMAILAQPIRIKGGHYGTRVSQWQGDAIGGGSDIEVEAYQF